MDCHPFPCAWELPQDGAAREWGVTALLSYRATLLLQGLCPAFTVVRFLDLSRWVDLDSRGMHHLSAGVREDAGVPATRSLHGGPACL